MRYKGLITLLAATSISAGAENYFDEIVGTIIANNGEIQSQRQEINSQALYSADENSLADPSIEFSRVWGRHSVGNKLQLDISQDFEWPGVYASRRKATEYGTSAALQGLISAEMDIATEIRMLLNELVYVRQQIKAMGVLQDNYDLLNKTVEKEIEHGELTVIDQKKIAIEGYKISNDLNDLHIREQQLESSIRGYCSIAVDLANVTYYPLQTLLDKDTYFKHINGDPAIEAFTLTAAQEEHNAQTAKMKRMPSFSVGYQHQAEMGDRFNGFTIGMNLPVFQGRHARKVALDRKEAAELGKEAIIAKKTAEVEALYKELQSTRLQMDQYNKVFGDNIYLELLLKAYKGGQIGMHEYISEMQYYNEVTMSYLATEYNYQQALTAINRYNNKF